MVMVVQFEWDEAKNKHNRQKHGVAFETAKAAFFDDQRVIAVDEKHSKTETRYHCYGLVNEGILTVRFTLRQGNIRIFGAAYWRKGVKIYEQKNSLRGKSVGG